MRISKVHLLLLVVFILYPLASLPIIFMEIYNRKYYSLYYLAIFVSLLGYLWVPSGDLYRYQLDFTYFKSLQLNQFANLPKLDFVLPWILFLVGKIGLNFEFVRFFLCIISYILYFKIYVGIINTNDNLRESRKVSFFSFLMFFCVIGFAGFLTGVRYTFAMSLCFYSVYVLMYRNRKVGWVILIFSVITHFSMALILLIVTFIKLIKPKFTRRIVIVATLAGYILSSFLIDYIIEKLPFNEIFTKKVLDYASDNAIVDLSDYSLGLYFSYLFTYFTIYPAIALILFRFKSYPQFSVFVSICVSLSLMTNIFTSYNRYAALGVVFFIIPFLLQYKILFTKVHFYFFLALSLFVYATSIYTFKKEISYGYVNKVLYLPLPAILMTTYDMRWLDDNIASDGDLRLLSK
jgi:hypothetical protein